MYAPARDDEITCLVAYLDQQLDALRAAPFGLTEAEARSTPCRSTLSVGALVKHVTYVMEGTLDRLAHGPRSGYTEEDFARHEGSLRVADDETTTAILERFDALRPEYLAALARLDGDTELLEPPAPWEGIHDSRPTNGRFLVLHQIEEMARHAGHADIIREQIDGAQVPGLVLSREGVAVTDFFTPFEPASGTIGASDA